jgi:DNA-binding SARP family transcriptional activator
MEFRLLGPLEVLDGARELPIGRGKPRVLLGILLLEAGRVVSSDRLIDLLWGERPPPTAQKALQLYVGRLRRVLGPGRIATAAPGYVLHAGPEEIDVRRFEALVARGRRAMAEGDAGAAARSLREALGLWRGPALPDAARDGVLQPEALRLEELRLGAIEDRIAADLELGRHAELVAELERLVAEHPLRERPRGQLMLALYRSGRQSEALAAYRDARRMLVEELGLEPGHELQALEAAILGHDPELRGPAAPVPVRDEDAPRPERKLATVLVAELQAGPGAPVDPERLGALLDRARDAAGEELEAAGGRVELGVAGTLLAAYGAPVAQEDHAERALNAAVALRTRLAEVTGGQVQARVGVDSGEVLARDTGVQGAPVDAARRLAATAAEGGVAVGERAAAAAGAAVDGGRLVGAIGRRGPPPAGTRPFVGRGGELALLEATWRRVVEGSRPHLVTVVGDPGVGKTSLVAAFRARHGGSAPWYAGRCLAYGRAITYRPLAEIVRERIGLRGTESEAVTRDRLGGRDGLGVLLGLEAEEDLHPWQQRERLREAWAGFLDELTADGPAVVLVEDLHWADDALLELLEQGVRQAAGALLLLTTARPELFARRPGWGTGRGDATRLALEPLPREDAVAMLQALAPGLGGEAREAVLDRAEGNPFFVEEVLASLEERGALRRVPDGWSSAGLTEALAVSDSVQAVIAARLDLLPAADKRVLQAAAVVGRVFWEDAVRALAAEPGGGLDVLEERDFVRRRPRSSLPGRREYAFKHALTREVAYHSLPVAPRARLHAAFAEWLEAAVAGGDEHAPLLAHHYAEAAAPAHADLAWAGEPAQAAAVRTRAVRWLRRAARLAADRYELADALALLAAAREREQDPAVLAELWHATAAVHRLGFDTDAFRSASVRALELDPDGPVAARTYAELAYAGSQPYVWRRPPETELVEHWIGEALRRAGPAKDVRALALVGDAHAHPATGVASADEAIALGEELDDADLRVRAFEAQLLLALGSARLEDALAWAERIAALASSVHDPHLRSGGLFGCLFAQLKAGRFAAARRVAVEHDELARPLSPHHGVHAVTGRVLVEAIAGRWEACAALAARAEAAADANAGTPCQFNWRSLALAALGEAARGDAGAARRLEAMACAGAVVGGPEAREPSLVRLALLRGDRRRAQELLDADPGAALHDVDYRPARLDALAWLGDRAGVEREAEAALAGYERPFALRALGSVRRRRDLLEQAAAAFDAMGLGWRAEETRALI